MLSSSTQTKQNMSFLSQKKKDFVQELTLILRPALLCHGSALFVWHHLPTLCSLLQQMWTAAGRVASHEERGDTRASQLQQDPWWIVKRACIFLNCPLIKSDETSYYLVLVLYCFILTTSAHGHFPVYSPALVVIVYGTLKPLNLQQPSRKPIPAYL